jgi:hypothetical protein
VAEPAKRPSPIESIRSKIPDEKVLDELTTQLDRTRQLLSGSPEEAAERALASFAGEAEVEARIAAELAVTTPVAHPDRFPEVHRLVMRALEVLDREGSRNPRVNGRYGPLKPLVEAGAEFVAEYIVKSYAQGIVGTLKNLYARREAQCPPELPIRRLLTRSRMEVERLAIGFSGGGIGAPALVVGGATVPLLASLSQYFGAIDFLNRAVVFGGLGVLFLLFLLLSSVLLTGARVAHRRSRLIMGQPLAALWECIGHAGNPPKDDSAMFATAAIALTALIWFVLPALAAVVYFVL